MKTLLHLILFIPFAINAQSNSDKIYHKLQNEEDVTYLSFSKVILDAIDITTENEDGTTHHVTGDLHQIKLLYFSENETEQIVSNYEKTLDFFASNYKEIDTDDDSSRLFIIRKGKKIHEAHLLLKEVGKGSLISFFGKLKAHELCQVSNALNLKACKHVKNL